MHSIKKNPNNHKLSVCYGPREKGKNQFVLGRKCLEKANKFSKTEANSSGILGNQKEKIHCFGFRCFLNYSQKIIVMKKTTPSLNLPLLSLRNSEQVSFG